MRYGENPGYPAAFYSEKEASGPNMATMEILQEGTKGLSYINIGDMDLGQRLVKKLTDIYENRLICVLVKHEMPSGVAKGESPEEAFAKAWNCDSLSNFGSVDVFNYRITGQLAELIVEKGRNIEVVYAPDFTPEALEVLASRKPLRIVKMGTALEAKASDNGLDFSNAIVIGMKDKVHGIGSGQRSRIDAAETAIRYSKRGYGPEGCVMASDAFIPFTDVVELAARSGIKAIIYPLGSVRDQDVIDKANEHNMAMIITRKPGESDSERCFLHR
jgi:phosphoribosylaminoimidazolecarboxamide formyltransferase/IMP cyclohydrolase